MAARWPFRTAAALAFSILVAGAGLAGASGATADDAAVAAVKQYVGDLAAGRIDHAFTLLTTAQQRYFGNARNFASNYTTTDFQIVRWSVAASRMHDPALAEVDVDQTTSFFDIAAGRTMQAHATEPYFALRSGGSWGVKEIYVPWKSYRPKTQGRTGSLEVTVDRVEFYDRRVQVDCTLRDVGSKPLQVLPLLKSTLTLGATTAAALAAPDFPLNDRQFYDGVRLYPLHQIVGFINFPLSSRSDRSYTARLVVGPVVEDGAAGPGTVVVDAIALPKL